MSSYGFTDDGDWPESPPGYVPEGQEISNRHGDVFRFVADNWYLVVKGGRDLPNICQKDGRRIVVDWDRGPHSKSEYWLYRGSMAAWDKIEMGMRSKSTQTGGVQVGQEQEKVRGVFFTVAVVDFSGDGIGEVLIAPKSVFAASQAAATLMLGADTALVGKDLSKLTILIKPF